MKKVNISVSILSVPLLLKGCKLDGGGSSGTDITPMDVPIEDLYGNWRTQVQYSGNAYTATITLLSSGYTCSIPGLGCCESGIYKYPGSVATLLAYFTGGPYTGTTQVVGTARYIGNDQIFLSLNNKSDLPGNYTLTR
jgi:hypothetical protein